MRKFVRPRAKFWRPRDDVPAFALPLLLWQDRPTKRGRKWAS